MEKLVGEEIEGQREVDNHVRRMGHNAERSRRQSSLATFSAKYRAAATLQDRVARVEAQQRVRVRCWMSRWMAHAGECPSRSEEDEPKAAHLRESMSAPLYHGSALGCAYDHLR